MNEQPQAGAMPGADPQVTWVPVVQGDANHCELCGRGPAKKLWLRSFLGMLIVTRIYSDNRWLCREHGILLAKTHLIKTSTVGWFSFMSLLANVVVIPADIIGLLRARALPEPVEQPEAAAPAPQPAAIAPAVAVPGEASPPAAGWYGDPTGSAQWRWWDGGAWTEQTA